MIKKIEIRDKASNYVDILYPKTSVDMVDGLQVELNNKANSSHTHIKSQISDFPTNLATIDSYGKVEKAYDADLALDSMTVNGFTVNSDVPINAKFTDTIYTHPTTHPASIIVQDASNRFVTDTEKSTWNNKANNILATTSTNGLMSATDKVKINSVATNLLDGSAIGSLRTVGADTESISKIGWHSFAQGYETKATGVYSHAEGYLTRANGEASHSEGYDTTASGRNSHSSGSETTASGNNSYASGHGTIAEGDQSHSEGVYTYCSGYASHAEGWSTYAEGDFSHVQGGNTTAETYSSFVTGCYNKVNSGSATTYSASHNALVIGNGTSSTNKSNAFRVDFSGRTYGLSAFNSYGADYAEYFEWLDGNPNNEDRIGKFVTLDGNKIRLATKEDDFILGIISGNQSIIGNAAEDGWNDMYVRDAFGRLIYEDVEVEREIDKDKEKNPIYKTFTETHIKVNPNYDSTKEYIPRSERKEWGVVGMIGQVVVYDDGTCEINKYCRPSKDGIATISNTGYRVLKRISTNLIMVLIK